MLNRIKKSLESIFDVPITVKKGYLHGNPSLIVYPRNDDEGLFEVGVYFKENLRIVLEVTPQRFALASLEEISNSSKEQRLNSSLFAKAMLDDSAKIDLTINGNIVDHLDYNSWPQKWDNYSCRITKIPISSHGAVEENPDIVIHWVSRALGMFISLHNVVTEECQYEKEGTQYEAKVRKYERSRINRELCLLKHGHCCCVCGMNFEDSYGIIGKNFIHVHHVVPVSQLGGSYVIDPTTDLVPVCPNCHAMLHRQNPPLTPEQLIEIRKHNAKI